jgi:hypothetical protein
MIISGRSDGWIPPGKRGHKWKDDFTMCAREVFMRVWTGFIGNHRIQRQAVVMSFDYAVSVERIQVVFHSWQEQ